MPPSSRSSPRDDPTLRQEIEGLIAADGAAPDSWLEPDSGERAPAIEVEPAEKGDPAPPLALERQRATR